MVISRACKGRNQQGETCRQPPLVEGEFCFWHDPEHAKEAADARRLGGARRKREVALQGVYAFEGLTSVPQIRRLLEVAAVDALALETSVAKVRTLVAVSMAAAKLLEVGELEGRVEALELAVRRHEPPTPIFGVEG